MKDGSGHASALFQNICGECVEGYAADTIRSVPLDKYEEVYGMSYEELLESYSNLEVDDYKRCLMAMRKKYDAETFEAPYAGAGALMGIKGDSALSSFTPSELTESSAIHGDFDQASLNYSGHQNIEVRAEDEDWECPCGSNYLRFYEHFERDGQKDESLDGFFCGNCELSPCGIYQTDSEPCTCDMMEYGKYTWLGERPRTQFPSYLDVEGFKKQEQDRENERIRIVGSKKKLDAIRKGAEGLGKDSCCCGATKSKPCACMKTGAKCSGSCACSTKEAEGRGSPYGESRWTTPTDAGPYQDEPYFTDRAKTTPKWAKPLGLIGGLAAGYISAQMIDNAKE